MFRLTHQLRPLNPKNTFASPTPILDGDRVYVHFGADGTAALSTSGEILWTARYNYDSQHGGGGSPVLYNDLLIFNCDGNEVEAFVVALDAKHRARSAGSATGAGPAPRPTPRRSSSTSTGATS